MTGKRPPEKARVAGEAEPPEEGGEEPEEGEVEPEEAAQDEERQDYTEGEEDEAEEEYDPPEPQRRAQVAFADEQPEGDEHEFDPDSMYPAWRAPFEPVRMMRQS